MVIFQIQVIGVAFLKAERQPPIGAYRYRPNVLTVALEPVQSKRGLVHILYATRLVQRRQNQTQTLDLVGPNFPGIALLKKVPQAFMSKALDQNSTVKR